MGKLNEGQKLWWVSLLNKRATAKEVTVTKVGRKWAQLDNYHRIDVETLIVDGEGYPPPGRVYLSREDYENSAARENAWSELRKVLGISSRVPAGVTTDSIAAARKLLGL